MVDRSFDESLDTKKVRKYTKKRLKGPSVFSGMKISITLWFIIVNIIIYVVSIAAVEVYGEDLVSSLFALQANLFFSGYVWTLLTSMFLHANTGHLLANMVSLFFIGGLVERIIGRKRFLIFYLLSGLFAGLFYVVLSYYFGFGTLERVFGSPEIFAVGASGAIFALAGLLAVLTPFLSVYLIAGPIIAIVIQSIFYAIYPNSPYLGAIGLLISIYFIFSIFAIFSFNPKIIRLAIPIRMPFWVLPIVAIVPLVIIGLFVSLPIGNSAHFGGLLAGLIYGSYLLEEP